MPAGQETLSAFKRALYPAAMQPVTDQANTFAIKPKVTGA